MANLGVKGKAETQTHKLLGTPIFILAWFAFGEWWREMVGIHMTGVFWVGCDGKTKRKGSLRMLARELLKQGGGGIKRRRLTMCRIWRITGEVEKRGKDG